MASVNTTPGFKAVDDVPIVHDVVVDVDWLVQNIVSRSTTSTAIATPAQNPVDWPIGLSSERTLASEVGALHGKHDSVRRITDSKIHGFPSAVTRFPSTQSRMGVAASSLVSAAAGRRVFCVHGMDTVVVFSSGDEHAGVLTSFHHVVVWGIGQNPARSSFTSGSPYSGIQNLAIRNWG